MPFGVNVEHVGALVGRGCERFESVRGGKTRTLFSCQRQSVSDGVVEGSIAKCKTPRVCDQITHATCLWTGKVLDNEGA